MRRSAASELDAMRAYDRRSVEQAMRVHLSTAPDVPTRNRKCLPEIAADFEYNPPLWELRVSEYRVFYEIDDVESVVVVHAIRPKPPHLTTQEIFR
jgi:mRNA-degrading endonuclease RelE of RelBE toxin-antitoxin system